LAPVKPKLPNFVICDLHVGDSTLLPCLIPLAAASPEDTTRQAGNLISNRRNQRAQPYKFKGQRVAGCLFRGAAELKFCMTRKGTAVKCIWQHAAENPRVVVSASFHDCKKATFKFHMRRTPRGCPGRLRRLLPFWFAVAQAKPGLATTLAIMHL